MYNNKDLFIVNKTYLAKTKTMALSCYPVTSAWPLSHLLWIDLGNCIL